MGMVVEGDDEYSPMTGEAAAGKTLAPDPAGSESVGMQAQPRPFILLPLLRPSVRSPAEIARTDSVPTIVAQGPARPEFLRIPHGSRFRREVLRSRNSSAVSRLLECFASLRHRYGAQGEQRHKYKHRELVHVCLCHGKIIAPCSPADEAGIFHTEAARSWRGGRGGWSRATRRRRSADLQSPQDVLPKRRYVTYPRARIAWHI